MQSIGFFFFFQAEDGIRDADVTGVQTCALPISPAAAVTGPEQQPGTDTIMARLVSGSIRTSPRSASGSQTALAVAATDRGGKELSGRRTAATTLSLVGSIRETVSSTEFSTQTAWPVNAMSTGCRPTVIRSTTRLRPGSTLETTLWLAWSLSTSHTDPAPYAIATTPPRPVPGTGIRSVTRLLAGSTRASDTRGSSIAETSVSSASAHTEPPPTAGTVSASPSGIRTSATTRPSGPRGRVARGAVVAGGPVVAGAAVVALVGAVVAPGAAVCDQGRCTASSPVVTSTSTSPTAAPVSRHRRRRCRLRGIALGTGAGSALPVAETSTVRDASAVHQDCCQSRFRCAYAGVPGPRSCVPAGFADAGGVAHGGSADAGGAGPGAAAAAGSGWVSSPATGKTGSRLGSPRRRRDRSARTPRPTSTTTATPAALARTSTGSPRISTGVRSRPCSIAVCESLMSLATSGWPGSSACTRCRSGSERLYHCRSIASSAWRYARPASPSVAETCALRSSSFTIEAGTAKFRPESSRPVLGSTDSAVATPTTLPCSSSTGPPLLPWVMPASVCRTV